MPTLQSWQGLESKRKRLLLPSPVGVCASVEVDVSRPDRWMPIWTTLFAADCSSQKRDKMMMVLVRRGDNVLSGCIQLNCDGPILYSAKSHNPKN